MSLKPSPLQSLAHDIANQILIYEMQASASPDLSVLSPEQLTAWRDILQSLRLHGNVLSQSDIDLEMGVPS